MNEKKSTRTLEQLVEGFKTPAGKFEGFDKNMSPEEKVIFKGWLAEMRAPRYKRC